MGVENPCLFVNGVISTQRLTNIHLLAIKVILHPKVLIKLQPILLDIILQELIEEWGCRFGRLALTTIDSSFIKDHRSVLVRLQHAERIHRTILGVDIPVTISLLIAGEFRSHESTSCPSKDSSRIVRHHDWEASNPSRNHLSTSLSQRSEEHTSELQSLMRISYAVFCLKQK